MKGHFLFEHFEESDLRRVLESGEAVIFNPNADLFRIGQPPSRVFILLRGTASRRVCPPRTPIPVGTSVLPFCPHPHSLCYTSVISTRSPPVGASLGGHLVGADT